MDWQTIMASIVSSGALTGTIGYALKKGFDKTLDLHFEKMKEENKALIQENLRRQAFVYDKQFDTLKTIASLTYRLRNTVKDILDQKGIRDEKLLTRFKTYFSALAEILFEERAVLPQYIFGLAHELKHALAIVMNYMEAVKFKGKQSKINDDEVERIYQDILKSFTRIDEICSLLVIQTQTALGLQDDNPDSAA